MPVVPSRSHNWECPACQNLTPYAESTCSNCGTASTLVCTQDGCDESPHPEGWNGMCGHCRRVEQRRYI